MSILTHRPRRLRKQKFNRSLVRENSLIASDLIYLLFEIDGVSEQIAKEALYKASAKLPIKTKFIKRFS